ncbi:MAG: DUF3604 domain-containing protein [Proteobacteria bacterium]|nr:DUF3604 domain-containing protein [Pseudomonadota bacterium]MDA1301404.1 DUF3604 domain-containing protein [Pseudomonadota bacterium]
MGLSISNTRLDHTLGPEEAYRFAKCEVVTMNSGMKTRLRRPLDFLMVADHVNNMGVMAGVLRRATRYSWRLTRVRRGSSVLKITTWTLVRHWIPIFMASGTPR